MTKEEILKRHFSEIFLLEEGAWMIEDICNAMDEYATQIVLDTLPKKFKHEGNDYREGYNEAIQDVQEQIEFNRLTTREEVDKPFRELLEEIKPYLISKPKLQERIGELMKK